MSQELFNELKDLKKYFGYQEIQMWLGERNVGVLKGFRSYGGEWVKLGFQRFRRVS